jgi:hypothetical protein
MNNYLEDRVKAQRTWYEDKANKNKKKFISYQTIIIVLGAVIPVIVALESSCPTLKIYGGPITAIISAIISIYAGLDKLMQPQPNWFNYRANEEAIKKEEWFFKYQAGPYKKLSEEEAKIIFVERIESIISADIARTSSSNGKKEENNGKAPLTNSQNDIPVQDSANNT